ncbi:MAG: hypothetical protein Q7U28_10350 [Aquabacterium sp.]|nr:hypothetical protein [Aquabacterium sp.]
MKNLIIAALLVSPVLAMAAPAVASSVTVQDNKATLTAAAAVKGSGNVSLGSLLPGASLGGNIETPGASINANSIKVRGGPVTGDMIMKGNHSGISAAIGGTGNVNSVDIDVH